jgi:hypothetical protein
MKMMDDSRAIPNNNQTMIDPNIPKLSKAAYIISSIIPKSKKLLTVYRKIIKLNYISMACWDQQCLL